MRHRSTCATSITSELGTTIDTHGSTALQAGRDLLARQATIDSYEGVLSVHATRDVKIEAGEASAAVAGSHQTTTKAGGLSGLFGGKITETLSGSFSATRPQGSRLSGDLLSITAGRAIDIEGSHLSGSEGVKLGAGGASWSIARRASGPRAPSISTAARAPPRRSAPSRACASPVPA